MQEGLLKGHKFPCCFEPHCQSEAKCKVFIMKISFHPNANKTNFQMKSFVRSLAFIMRFTATQKWPIDRGVLQNLISVKYGYRFAVGGEFKLTASRSTW